MKTTLSALCGVLALLFVSCEKDLTSEHTPDTANPFIGSWKILSSHTKTKSTVKVTDGNGELKSITSSDYSAQNLQGTYEFKDSTISATGLSYEINTIAHVLSYQDDVLIDSLDLPFEYTIPETAGTTSYKMIGSDSIAMSLGFASQIPGINPADLPSQPVGHFSVSGDTLYINNYLDFSYTDSTGASIHDEVSTLTGLLKQ